MPPTNRTELLFDDFISASIEIFATNEEMIIAGLALIDIAAVAGGHSHIRGALNIIKNAMKEPS